MEFFTRDRKNHTPDYKTTSPANLNICINQQTLRGSGSLFQWLVELVRNLVAHGDAREWKWRGNWRMEWVASTLTPPPNVAYPALLNLMRTPWLPAVDWTDTPTDLNGLIRFGERRNLVSARVPSRSARAIPARIFGKWAVGISARTTCMVQ